jgi:hypothetical protein
MTSCRLLRMQQSPRSSSGTPGPADERAADDHASRAESLSTESADQATARQQTELEEIELLSELMILANRAAAKAPTYEIDQALGLRDELARRNAS